MGKGSKILSFGEMESGIVWTDEVDLPIASFFIHLEKQEVQEDKNGAIICSLLLRDNCKQLKKLFCVRC